MTAQKCDNDGKRDWMHALNRSPQLKSNCNSTNDVQLLAGNNVEMWKHDIEKNQVSD